MSRWSWCGGGGRSGGRGGRWHCLVLALVAPPLAVLVLGVGVALPVIAARGLARRWHCLVLALVAPPLAVLVLEVGVALHVVAARGLAQSWHSLVLALVTPPLVVLVLGVGVALHGVVCVCVCDRVAPPPRMLKFRLQIQQFGITREWQFLLLRTETYNNTCLCVVHPLWLYTDAPARALRMLCASGVWFRNNAAPPAGSCQSPSAVT